MQDDDRIDPHEAKLLGDILALVVGDQPGPAAAALETLRRRAGRDRITGGAIKAAFERVIAAPAAPHPGPFAAGTGHAPERERDLAALSRRMLREAEAHRAAMEAAAEREADLRAEARRRRRGMALAIAIAPCCLGLGFAAGRARPAAGWPTNGRTARIEVDPVTLPPEPARAGGATEDAAPVEPAVLPADAREAIARRLLACRLLPDRPRASWLGPSWLGPSWFSGPIGRAARPVAFPGAPAYRLRVEARLDATGAIRGARIAAPPGVRQDDPAFHALAEPIGRRLLGPDCAGLPIPPALLGRIRAIGLVLTP